MDEANQLEGPAGIPLELLGECPAFQFLAEEDRLEISRLGRRERRGASENLLVQGDPPGPAYLIEAGRARVVRVEDSGDRAILGLRIRGDLVGERALLTKSPRGATVRAASELVVWRIEQADFERLVERHPRLARSLDLYFDQITVRTFMKSVAQIGALPPEDIRRAAERIERVSFPPGTEVVRQGEPGQEMYFLASGKANVLVDGRPVRVFGPGTYFGERALLTEEPRNATVVASTELELLRLSRAHFEEMLSGSPGVRRKFVDELAARLESSMLRLDYGIEEASPEAPVEAPLRSRPRAWPAWIRRAFPHLVYRVVLQRDAMECGPACLTTILLHHGIRWPIHRVRERIEGFGVEGASLDALGRAAQGLGFSAHWASRTLESVDRQGLPAIAHWEGCHYVVLLEIGPDRVLVADPAVGLREIPPAVFVEGWTGILIELRPTAALDRLASSESSWRALVARPWPDRRLALAWTSQAVVETGLLLTSIGLLAAALAAHPDEGAAPRALRAGLLLGLIPAWMLVGRSRRSVFAKLWRGWCASIDEEYLSALLALPERYVERLTEADRQGRARIAIEFATWGPRHLEPMALSALLGTCLAVDLVLLAPASGALVVCASLASGVLWWLGETSAVPARTMAEAHGSLAAAHLAEVLVAPGRYRAERVLGWVRRRWRTLAQRASRDATPPGRADLAAALAVVPILAACAALLAAGRLPGRFLIESGLLVAILARAVLRWTELSPIRLRLGWLREVLDSAPLADEPVAAGTIPPPVVRFESVSGRGRDAEPLLEDLTLEVPAGGALCLVGPPGSGAAQALQLVAGDGQVHRGRVAFDGADGRPIESPRPLLVDEDPLVLGTTVTENLLATDGAAPPEGAYADALERLDLRPYLRQLPFGDATRLGPTGLRLPLPERQKIHLARVVLSPPPVLLLVRPLSALDPAPRWRTLRKVLEALRGRSTVLFVPVSPAEAELAERVAWIEDGRLRAVGTPAEVARDPAWVALIGSR